MDESSQISRNAIWYVNLRWFAVTGVAISVVVAVPLTHVLPYEVLGPLLVLTLVLAAANVVFRRLLSTHGSSRRFLLVQVLTDLAILTLLLHYSGGIENPLGAVYLFHVILAGILLSRRHAYMLASVSSFLYLGLGVLETKGFVPHHALAMVPHRAFEGSDAAHEVAFVVGQTGVMMLLLFGSTYFTTLIADRLRSTERQLADASRTSLEEKRRLEGVVDASGAGLAVIDAQGRTVWRNIRAERWLRSLASTGYDGAHPSTDLARLALTERSRREKEFVVEQPDGHRRHLHVTATPVMGADGEPTQVVQLVQDVTVQRTAEQGMIQAAKLAGIGELAGSLAHELNNPLAVLSAKARLLLRASTDAGLSEKVRTELAKIVDHADRMAAITGGLLAFARPSSGELHPTDVNEAVRRAVEFLESRTKRTAVNVEVSVAADLPKVSGNLTDLQQVIVNLATNALDAMPDGGDLRLATRALRDRSTGRARSVVVEVVDTGPGIPLPERSRIFEPFYSTKPEGRGTGLGLAICQRIVAAHAGTIQVMDGRLGGALFRVTLPAENGHSTG